MSRKSSNRIAVAVLGIFAIASWPVSSMAGEQKKGQSQHSDSSQESTGAYGSGQQENGEKEKTGAYGTGSQQQRMLDSRGQDFLKNSAQQSMGVAQLSKIAQQKATSPAVRQYAQSVVNESQNIDKQLQHLASQNNITLPSSMSDDIQSKQKDLQGMTGKDFERQYLDTVVSQRQESIDKYVEMAESKDAPPQVRTFAIQTLPLLRMQVMQGQSIQQQMSSQGGQTSPQQRGEPQRGGR